MATRYPLRSRESDAANESNSIAQNSTRKSLVQQRRRTRGTSTSRHTSGTSPIQLGVHSYSARSAPCTFYVFVIPPVKFVVKLSSNMFSRNFLACPTVIGLANSQIRRRVLVRLHKLELQSRW